MRIRDWSSDVCSSDLMWQGANLAFGLCPLLTQAAIDALREVGTEEQKRLYLGKLVSGEWTGTMNLTEPQAGTDLGAIRTRAEKAADGSFRPYGQKIFITYADHDSTDTIIHLVLARSPAGLQIGPASCRERVWPSG